MRLLFKLLFLLITSPSPAQTLEEHEKNSHFQNGREKDLFRTDGRQHSVGGQSFCEQNQDQGNLRFGLLSIAALRQSLVANRYQKEGNYCGNSRRKNLNDIRKKFPYNTMHAIKVVSFKGEQVDSFYIERKIPKTAGGEN